MNLDGNVVTSSSDGCQIIYILTVMHHQSMRNPEVCPTSTTDAEGKLPPPAIP